MSMNAISPEREERRRRQKELSDRLKASGAMDEIFATIDAGEPLTGEQGLLGGMLKAALERGLDAELTEHVGYDRGDAEASLFPNSRNGTTPKTVSTEIGDIELAVPRDRNGSFTPMLVPKGSRRLDGLDGMIISLYAGGMTTRDIQHHLASMIGTELSHETISKITDQVAEEVLAWQHRPLESLYLVIYLDAIIVKIRDGGTFVTRRPISPSVSIWTGSSMSWESGCKRPKVRSSGRRSAQSLPAGARSSSRSNSAYR